MNTLLEQIAPIFGTMASWGRRSKKDQGENGARRAEADGQNFGIRYKSETPFKQCGPSRFPLAEIYSPDEKAVWEAIAIVRSRFNPWPNGLDKDSVQPAGYETGGAIGSTRNGTINNYVKGFYVGTNGLPEAQLDQEPFAAIPGADPWERRAAYYCAKRINPHGLAGQNQTTLDLYDRILLPVWTKWQDFDPVGASDPSNALVRCTAGNRDFDFNIDGLAHYGMLPDFLQDVTNIGVTPEQRASLFSAAEPYIQLWEKCVDPTRRGPAIEAQLE